MIKKMTQLLREGSRISSLQARELFLKATDDELIALAQIVRSRYHEPDQATYLIMSIINYTNICVAKCDYCSFYRLPHQSGTYLLSKQDVLRRVQKSIDQQANFVAFNGGFHPKLGIPHYAEVFSAVREHFGDSVEFYGMTVAEFMFASRVSKMPYLEAALCLKKSGHRWVPGGGAEILHDEFRTRHSPGKFKVADYYQAQSAILQAGLGSTATMVIGFDETLDERLYHLESLRDFQDSVGGRLPSFLCWTYKPWNNALGGDEITTQEYLRWLAISRIFLDNFRHIRTSVLTQNASALLGLKYGADDFDLPLEDEVTEKAGATIESNLNVLIAHAKNLGFNVSLRPCFSVVLT